MGKHANSRAYREWERQQDRLQDKHLDDEPPLSEFEKAAEWDDAHWERVDYPRTNRQWGGV
jgi:hypothetical protein